MIAFYLLAGTVGGFVGFAGAIFLGASFLAAFGLYVLGGLALIALAAAARMILRAERSEPVGQPQDA